MRRALLLCAASCAAPREARGLLAPRGGPAAESFSASLHTLEPAERLRRVTPIAWVHVAKAGATFMNAVVHLPGVCPGLGTADTDYVCSSAVPDCDIHEWARRHGGDRSFPRQCTGISRWGGHSGFGTEYGAKKGRAFIMLRQPEQRLISGYHNPGGYGPHGWPPSWARPRDITEYAKAASGAAVKMLARDVLGWIDPFPVSSSETRLAVRRLREGFAFVGLTDRYELSICLLHSMFGGECSPYEFRVAHTGKAHIGEGPARYNATSYFGDWRDTADNLVYDEAERIFDENLVLYGVSRATCRSCFAQAGLL